MPDFESLLERLVQHEFEFVIIGGFAAVAHGVTLLTEDLDVCSPFTAENMHRLGEAVADLNPVHRLVPARPAFQLTQLDITTLENLYLDTDWGVLDCLSSVKGVGDYWKVIKESLQIDLPIGLCRILSLDALIRAKEAMNTPKDKLTILQLRALRERKTNR